MIHDREMIDRAVAPPPILGLRHPLDPQLVRVFLTMDIQNIRDVSAFITKDGSEIRELLAHRNSCIEKQSLAEARVPAGTETTPHYHPETEEIYYILVGEGEMTIDGHSEPVGPGDAIAIPPQAKHSIRNTGEIELRFLCCCAPGYEHEDTVLLDE